MGTVNSESSDGVTEESADEIQKRLSTLGSPSRSTPTANDTIPGTPEEGGRKEKKRKSLFGNKKKSQKSSSELSSKSDS